MILIPLKYRRDLSKMGAREMAGAFVAKDKLSFIAIYLTEDSAILGVVVANILGFHPGLIPLPQWTILIGVFAMVAGEAIRLWSTYTLGKFFTYIVVIARDHKLVIRGPYRFVRHPAYLGGLLIFIGLAIISQSWVIAVTIITLLCLAYAYRIHVEEVALRQKFGKGYKEYSRKTAMIIPHLL